MRWTQVGQIPAPILVRHPITPGLSRLTAHRRVMVSCWNVVPWRRPVTSPCIVDCDVLSWSCPVTPPWRCLVTSPRAVGNDNAHDVVVAAWGHGRCWCGVPLCWQCIGGTPLLCWNREASTCVPRGRRNAAGMPITQYHIQRRGHLHLNSIARSFACRGKG